jgi:hypothetical protein
MLSPWLVRVNHQSMAPPSTHPEGKSVMWVQSDPQEMVVEKTLLMRSVQLTATGTMVARYYNVPGDRHDWGLALAGLLRRLSITHHQAETLFEPAAQRAKDDKVKDRLDAIRTTYSREDVEHW